ncbi:uncharacterized protein METZ01_LOCUS151050 [marine metagenome]|uniref:Major tropism determinant N-terminal domain-containing protein n=1 Tax=marine metagenome TaxID=408172 RepID=A0A382A9I0_9ZZZZ
MATVIQFKRSSTQNDLPTTGDLALGELAVNTYHGRFYTEKNDGSAAVVEVGSIPASLTINDAITFPTADGSNGQVIKTNGSGTLSWGSIGGSGISIFKYTLSGNVTVFTGNDDDSNSLTYTVGSEQVFLNGVKLVDGGADYTATNTTTITLAQTAISGDVLEVVAVTAADLVQGYYTASALTTTSANQVLSSNAVANKAIKYVLSATHATAGTHAAEVLLINNGSSAFFVQYGDVFSTASLFSLTADVNSGNMRLLVTPANTNTTIDTFQIRHS